MTAAEDLEPKAVQAPRWLFVRLDGPKRLGKRAGKLRIPRLYLCFHPDTLITRSHVECVRGAC
jgi:hypothetical protein